MRVFVGSGFGVSFIFVARHDGWVGECRFVRDDPESISYWDSNFYDSENFNLSSIATYLF